MVEWRGFLGSGGDGIDQTDMVNLIPLRFNIISFMLSLTVMP